MPETLTKTIRFTEYLLSPYDGRRTEFVAGEIIYMAEASPLHADIIDFLLMLLKTHIAEKELGQVVRASAIGIEIPRIERENNVRDPDLIVCDRNQWKEMRHLTKAIFATGNPPALAVEVVSPGNKQRDTKDKREEYALSKVPEYWIVNPVDGYVLTLAFNRNTYVEIGEYRGSETIKSLLFPNLVITAAALLDPD